MLSRRDFVRLTGIGAASLSPVARAFLRDEPRAFVGEEVFTRLRNHFTSSKLDVARIGLAVGQVGTELIATPYLGATLELFDDRELCCVNLLGLDCVTFYEVALCFARMVRAKEGRGGISALRPQDLVKEVQYTRYRGGKLNGYLSRLHYTSDWMADNQAKGVVDNLTGQLPGALRMDKRFDFMSTHPQLYRQLKANPELVPQMAALEERITAAKPWYVPNDKVAEIEPLLETGDIVGIATKAEGLDCSHTGLVYVDDNKVRRFLNASSVKMQVVLGERLSDYAVKYKKNLGVMIARPI